MLIRRVWVGPPPDESVSTQMDRYRAVAPASAQEHWSADGGLVTSEDPHEVAERLHQQVQAAGCQALNVRVFQAGVSPEACREQIDRVGREVLPALRRLGGWAAEMSGS